MQITTLDPLTAPAATDKYKQTLSSDFDNFLTMLTTQLQNQDPLAPLDSTEFTNQLVQFSQLEQQINQSGKIEDLIAVQKASEAASALGYLGNEVEMISAVAMLDNGTARFAYDMPVNAKTAAITIFDQKGNIVRNINGEKTAGRHDVAWDGTNDQGVQLPDGAYSVLVAATDDNEDPLTNITVYSRGVADEVVSDSGLTYLRVGDIYVPLDRIVSVGAIPETIN